MEIKHIDIALLEGNSGQVDGLPANPRKWTQREVERIAASLQETPELLEARPLVVVPNGSKYVVLGGNLRLAGIKHNQGTTAPCAVLPDDTSAAKLKEIVIKDNSSFGEWDFDLLSAEWDDMPLDDWGVKLSIDEDEVLPEDTTTEVVDDEVPTDAERRVQRGDVWLLGEHRLMCGDSTSAEDVAKLMNGEQADCVLTDPPFGNDLGYGRGQLGERYIMNDGDTKVLTSFFAPLDAVLKNNSHCLVWIQWRTFSTLEKAFEKYKLRTVVIWDKLQPGLSGGGFAEQYEMMCVFIKGKATQNEYCGNVWQIPREHDKRSESEHPHKKPIALLGKALNLCSHEGETILDVFGGSGSTLIACEQLGRKCRMMEIDPHYCDIIIKRWEVATGGLAIKK